MPPMRWKACWEVTDNGRDTPYKANPSLGQTIQIQRVRDAFQEALDNPAEENVFKQLRLNMWVSSLTRFMYIKLCSTIFWMPCIYPMGISRNWLRQKRSGSRRQNANCCERLSIVRILNFKEVRKMLLTQLYTEICGITRR